jgi:hypothetical protein
MKPDKSLKDMTVEEEDERVKAAPESRVPSRVSDVVGVRSGAPLSLSHSSAPLHVRFNSPFPALTSPTGKSNVLSLGFPHPYLFPPVESVRSSLTISSNVVTRVQQELLQLTVRYDTSTRMATKYVVHAERKTPPASPKMYCVRRTSGEVHALTLPCTHRLILWMQFV